MGTSVGWWKNHDATKCNVRSWIDNMSIVTNHLQVKGNDQQASKVSIPWCSSLPDTDRALVTVLLLIFSSEFTSEKWPDQARCSTQRKGEVPPCSPRDQGGWDLIKHGGKVADTVLSVSQFLLFPCQAVGACAQHTWDHAAMRNRPAAAPAPPCASRRVECAVRVSQPEPRPKPCALTRHRRKRNNTWPPDCLNRRASLCGRMCYLKNRTDSSQAGAEEY